MSEPTTPTGKRLVRDLTPSAPSDLSMYDLALRDAMDDCRKTVEQRLPSIEAEARQQTLDAQEPAWEAMNDEYVRVIEQRDAARADAAALAEALEEVNQAHFRDHGEDIADVDGCETCAALAGIYSDGPTGPILAAHDALKEATDE